MHWDGWWGWGVGGMWLLWIVVIVAVIVFIARASGRAPSSRGPSAEEILKERYARGEIDVEEYRTRLRELRR